MPLIRFRRFYCYFDIAKISSFFVTAKYYSEKKYYLPAFLTFKR